MSIAPPRSSITSSGCGTLVSVCFTFHLEQRDVLRRRRTSSNGCGRTWVASFRATQHRRHKRPRSATSRPAERGQPRSVRMTHALHDTVLAGACWMRANPQPDQPVPRTHLGNPPPRGWWKTLDSVVACEHQFKEHCNAVVTVDTFSEDSKASSGASLHSPWSHGSSRVPQNERLSTQCGLQ